MEDSPCSRACDKSSPVSGHFAYELFRHVVCPLIVGDVTEDEPEKRDQLDQTHSTLNSGVTEADVRFKTIDLRTKIQQRNGPIGDRQLGNIVQVCCSNHYEAARRRFGGAM